MSEPGDEAKRLAELERRGTIRRPAAALPERWFADRPEIPADVVAAILRERAEGR